MLYSMSRTEGAGYAWKARSKEEAKDAIRRATSELFFHNVVEESYEEWTTWRSSHTLELEKKASPQGTQGK